MHTNQFGHATPQARHMKGPPQITDRNGTRLRRQPRPRLQVSWEQPRASAVRFPEGPQGFQGGFGQRHEALLVAFTADAQELALPVDITHLQTDPFADAKATTVDGAQTNAIDWRADAAQQEAHLGTAQHDGQFLLFGRVGQFEDRPGLVERLRKQEFDAGQGDLEGPRGAMLLLSQR
jgi:hypothetical protein